MIPHAESVPETVAPLQGAEETVPASGGLRYATTTGYCLAAFQAEIRSLLLPIPIPTIKNL